MTGQYNGVRKIFSAYWSAYGGACALLASPYLHAALVLLVLTQPTWLHRPWWDHSFLVLPNMLGFTLGGFAIFLGFGDDKFRALLAEQPAAQLQNDYVALCATFVHFIVVQSGALVAAILAAAWWDHAKGVSFSALRCVFGAIGYGAFLYAVMLAIAAAMHVFRVARIYAKFINQSKTVKPEANE